MQEKELEKIFKALANKRRLAIVRYLKSKPRATVGEIADKIKLSFKATSKHLIILANADIAENEQVGLSVFYSLARTNNSAVNKILSIL